MKKKSTKSTKKKANKTIPVKKGIPKNHLAYYVAGTILAVVLIFTSFNRSGESNYKNLVSHYALENLEKIEISKPSDQEIEKIELIKKQGSWILNGTSKFSADKEKIEEFIDSIQILKNGVVISKNPERANLFGTTEKEGVKISLSKSNGELEIFYVGKTSSLNEQYFKNKNSDYVLAFKTKFNRFLDLKKEEWRDLNITNIQEEEITGITLQKEGNEKTFERNQSKWSLKENDSLQEVNELSFRTLLKKVAQIKAESIIKNSEASQIKFNESPIKLTIQTQDGSQEIVFFEGEEKIYVKKTDEEFTYSISKESFETLFSNSN